MTAYELRIRGLSSDVGSSVLERRNLLRRLRERGRSGGERRRQRGKPPHLGLPLSRRRNQAHERRRLLQVAPAFALLRNGGPAQRAEIGRRRCRESVCESVWI